MKEMNLLVKTVMQDNVLLHVRCKLRMLLSGSVLLLINSYLKFNFSELMTDFVDVWAVEISCIEMYFAHSPYSAK
jgi:hypothetical protein